MTTRTRLFPTGLKAVVGVLFAALFFFGLQAPAAHADPDINLTVNLTSKGGTALTGVTITAYQWENHGAKPFAPRVTSTSLGGGKYALNGLENGQEYTFYFDAPSTVTTLFDQFYGGTTWIEEAAHTSFFASKNFDVSLATNSTITGTVTGSSSAKLAGVTVYPLRFDGSDWFPLYSKQTTTSATGAYALRNLEPGSYKIAFVPKNTSGYLTEYSGNAADDTSATPVFVGLGLTATSNAQLAKGGSISGKVALEDSVTGDQYIPAHMTAWAYPYDTGSNTIDPLTAYVSKPTTSNGKWTVTGLPTGTYVVKLYDDYYGFFYPEWSPSAPNLGSATKYNVVAPGSVSTGTTVLLGDEEDQTVHIEITHNGNPIDSDKASVYIESNDGEDYVYRITPDDLGTDWGLANGEADITFPRVPSGSYTVYVDPGVPGLAPFVGTKTKSFGPTTWTFPLTDPSAFTFTTAPTLDVGGTSFGDTLTVTPAQTTLDPDVEYSYIWLRNDAPIYGSTSSTYTIRPADAGTNISVIVRADTFGYGPLIATLDGPSISFAPTPANLIAPSISGPATPVPGDILTANVGKWDLDDVTFNYEWHDGSNLLGTGKTYKVGPTDPGKTITLYVIPSAPGRPTGGVTVASNSKSIDFLPAPVLKTSPKFTSKKTGGNQKFTVTKGTWTPAATSTLFTFYINGSFIASNTTGTFTCTASPVNCPPTAVVEVEVSASVPGSLAGEKRLLLRKATAPSIFTPLNPGSVDDTSEPAFAIGQATPVEVGHTLFVHEPTYDFSGDAGAVTYAYQWEAQAPLSSDWDPISNAKSKTYVPTPSIVGWKLRVIVTTKTANYGSFVDAANPLPAGTVVENESFYETGIPGVNLLGNGMAGRGFRAKTTGPVGYDGVTTTWTWYECDHNTDTCDNDIVPLTSDWNQVAVGTDLYTPPSGDVGFWLLVELTVSKPGYKSINVRSGTYELVADTGVGAPYGLIDPKIVSGLVNGKAVIGKQLTASHAVWDMPLTDMTPFWEYCPVPTTCSFYSGWVAVPGDPKTLTYTPTPDLIELSDGRIRYTEFGQANSASNPATTGDILLQPLTLKQTKAASFKKTGSNWVVNPGTWTSGTTFSYQWFVVDAAQPGTTNTFGVITDGPVYVQITAHKSGYSDVTKRLVVLKGKPTLLTSGVAPSVFGTGAMDLDSDLFAFGMAAPEVTTSYQWYAGTKAISGAKSATYTPVASLVGKPIKLKVTVKSPLYATTSRYSTAVVLSAHPAASGTATLSSNLSGFYPGAVVSVGKTGFPAGTTYTYKWERSNDGVGGWATVSTGATLPLGATDPTKFFRATIVGKTAGWTTPAPVVSDVIEVDYAPTIDTIGVASLLSTGGAPRVGSPLTFDATFNTTGLTLVYTWYRNGVEIPGATTGTYTPPAGALGDDIRAEAHASKPGHIDATFTTNTVAIGIGTAPAQTALAKISGMTGTGTPKAPKVGNVLTATPGVWNVDGLTFDYQWYANGVPIPFQDRNTYTVAPGDVGKTITVQGSGVAPAGRMAGRTRAPRRNRCSPNDVPPGLSLSGVRREVIISPDCGGRGALFSVLRVVPFFVPKEYR